MAIHVRKDNRKDKKDNKAQVPGINPGQKILGFGYIIL